MRNKDFVLERNEGGFLTARESQFSDFRDGENISLKNRIFTAILVRRGTLVSDPNWGSDLHRIKLATPYAETMFVSHVKSALKPLSNIISNVQVFGVQINSQTGRLNFSVSCVKNTQQFSFDYWISI